MTPFSTRWRRAEEEHHESLAAFQVAALLVPDHKWAIPLPPSEWSPAQMMQHVAMAYRFGRDEARGETGMRLVRPRWMAWLLRHTVMPLMFLTKRFPKGAPAPRELRPSAEQAHAIPREQLVVELQTAAREALAAIRAVADKPTARITHPYFGALTPYEALRLLSAHTRHHAGILAPPKIKGPDKPCIPEQSQAA